MSLESDVRSESLAPGGETPGLLARAAPRRARKGSAVRAILDYRRYPAFSWDWSWRRCAIFGFFISLEAIWTGIQQGETFRDWRPGLEACALTLLIGLITIAPLLAAWIRSLDWPLDREKLGVVAAVLLGIAMGHAGQWLANERSERVLVPRAVQEGLVGKQYLVLYRAHINAASTRLAESLLFFFLSGGLGLWTYFQEQRRLAEEAHEREVTALQLQKRQTDLQLLVLQAQIEPHFLFNTLASLRSLLRQDIAHAEAMLDALVAHLRSALPVMRESKATSTLAEQLAVCGSYLELMKIRLPDRLSYSVHVPSDLQRAPFPPLVLLTLVENAVKHGIEPKPGPGHIRIDAQRERRPDGTHLVVSVSDDGAGLSSGLGHGVGLANIRSQLAIKYGGRAALSLSGSIEGGAIASIDIPEDEGPAS